MAAERKMGPDLAEIPEADRSAALSIKPDYQTIRLNYVKVCIIATLVTFVLEAVMVPIAEPQGLVETTVLDYAVKYLILPSIINFCITAFAWISVRKEQYSEFALNLISLLSLNVVLTVDASFHWAFDAVTAVFVIPVFMAAIMGSKQVSVITYIAAMTGLTVATAVKLFNQLARHIFNSVSVINIVVTYIILIMTFVVTRILLRLLNVQKFKLIAATREARAANQAKTEFLASMSHEIRTPLNAILGMTEIIVRESTEPQVRDRADDVLRAGNLLLGIVNDVLDITTIESGGMALQEGRYELGSLLNDSCNMVAMRCKEKGLSLTVTCDPDLPRLLFGDEYRLRQVLVNLLSNAVKYTREGGVELFVSGEDSGEILRLELRVKDTGTGIREEDLPVLFDKFIRLDKTNNRHVEGTGLGLAITKQLVELMGGEITVESVYGLGSLFTVRIPQKVVDHTPIGDVHVTYLNLHAGTEVYRPGFEAPEARILAVDDAPINLQVISRLLEATRIRVDTALSGVEAVEKAKRERYDLIFMDHMMPGMDGVEAMRAIRDLPGPENDGVPIVMLTANAMSGAEEEYLGLGFADYLAKPIRGSRLEATLLKHLPREKVSILSAAAEAAVQAPSGPLDSLTARLPEFNAAAALDYCGGTEDFVLSMLSEFVAGGRDRNLEGFLAAEDWPGYQVEVHALKSDARTVGLAALADEALILEEAARGRDGRTIRENHPGLMEHYRAVVAILKELLDRR